MKTLISLSCVMLLVGCANQGYKQPTSYAPERATPVTILDVQKVRVSSSSGLGGFTGAVGGGAIGAAIGTSSAAHTAGIVLGLLAGAFVGNELERQVTETDALRIVVKTQYGQTYAITQYDDCGCYHPLKQGYLLGDRVIVSK